MRVRLRPHCAISATARRIPRPWVASQHALNASGANSLSQSINLNNSSMPREGTRSQTGHSKPRVFPVVDTAPAVKRKTKPAAAKKDAAPKAAKGAKPTGVTKKKAPKKETGVAKKVLLSVLSRLVGGGDTIPSRFCSRGSTLTQPAGQGRGEEG